MLVIHNPPHWNYYRLLERDLEECFRFVEPVPGHFDVFSNEFARIILVAATEIENALRGLAEALSYTPTPSSILDYFICTTSKFPSIATMEMFVPRYSLRFTPWEGWSSSTAPDWWSFGYNKIKHDRLKHPTAPTLIRATKAVAALQVVLLHYYRVKYPGGLLSDDNVKKLIVPFEKDNPDIGGATILWDWDLPDDPKQNP